MIKEAHDKKIKYVFFDIFDTILKRKIEPEYVKKIWSNNLIKYLNLDINAIKLYNLRNKVESELGEFNKSLGNDCEISYLDIIKKIYEELNINLEYNNFLEACTDIEVNLESKVLIPMDDIIDEIKKLKKENKKIICISDMYLTRSMIEKIFTNLHIINLFDHIYVSSEYLKNKKTGNLYDIVFNNLKVESKDCIMIGDNKHSDYSVAIEKGMKAIHLNRQNNYEEYKQYLETHNPQKVMATINKLSKNSSNDFENTIFSLFNFIEKLYYNLLKRNANEVFFLSREGEYLKKLFDYYCENAYCKKINSHYLYVSRKATYLPSLKEIEKEDFASLLNQYSNITVLEFLKSLNFEQNEIKEILISYKKDAKEILNKIVTTKRTKKSLRNIITDCVNVKIPFFKQSGTLKVLKNNVTFKRLYEEKRIEQKNNFIKYIKDKTDNKKIYVVDIGWNGSIQNNIQEILGHEYNVEGFYFGLNRRNKKEKYQKNGLIFNNYPVNKEYSLYNENRALYEIILGASHGSANKYNLNGNGKIEVSLFALKEEERIFNDIIRPLQERMFEIYKELVNVLGNGFFDNQEIYKKFNRIQFTMLFKPNKSQLQFFNKIHHYENFGVFEFTEFNKNKKITLFRYIKENAKFLLRNKTYFNDSYWPVLKLKNFNMYVPYYMYYLIIKIRLKIKGVL